MKKHAHVQVVEKKKPKKRAWLKWASLAAACFALVICAIPIMNLILGGSNGDAPVSNTYNSIEEVHTVLGYDTCLDSKSRLEKSEIQERTKTNQKANDIQSNKNFTPNYDLDR